jgi:competence protein ComEA
VVLALVVLSAAVGLGIMRGQAAPVESVPLTDTGTGTGPGSGSGPESTGELYVHVLGAVGGTTADADLTAVNLARVLEDGEQIVVPAAGALVGAPGGAAPPPGDDRIDLNTADQAALETLPRIGPALAERIIAWREENGRFTSIDDLLAVPGIGEKLLAGLRDGVRV